MAKTKGICGHAWTVYIGKIRVNHRCGEESGHRGPHICSDCGQTG